MQRIRDAAYFSCYKNVITCCLDHVEDELVKVVPRAAEDSDRMPLE